jgi:hypothetical protein
MGYEPDECIGRFIGDFHVDQDVIQLEAAPRGPTQLRFETAAVSSTPWGTGHHLSD